MFLSLLIPIILLFLFFRRRKEKQHLPLPPGPPKYPLIGNLLNLPKSFEWETYAQWSVLYNSDLIHLNAVGTNIIILNSYKAVSDLFDRRSAIYSSRPQTVMLHQLMDWGSIFGLMPYGEPWKERRKLFTQHFHPRNDNAHHPVELEYSRRMLRCLLESPREFMNHNRFVVGAATISMAYGLDIQSHTDPCLQIIESAMTGLTAAAAPGAFLVDSIPCLKYIPSWMPGAGFKRKAKAWNILALKMLDVPFQAAEKAIAEGTAKPSFVSRALADMDKSSNIDHQRKVIRDTAGTFFVAGADTTVSALNTFFLAMTCYPEIQRKAQAELDSVILPGHLPVFEDEPRLPFTMAIVKEVLRWRSISPLAVPRCVMEDDVYEGYFIPKGSIVAGNSWALTHDENEYPDPFAFKPDRFITINAQDGKFELDSTVRDPNAAFGFGRRQCPGKHMALSTLWINIASILSVYDISPRLDERGREVPPEQEYISDMLLRPAPFECVIKPRSEAARKLVQSLDV